MRPAPSLWLLILAPLSLACASETRPVATAADPAHASRTSLDWAGTYRGVLPCADCPGIETTVTLKADGAYVLTTRDVDREQAGRETTGTFTWDAAGRVVTVGEARYEVVEGALVQLDPTGREITGAPARRHRLEKVMAGASVLDPALVGRTWKLVELRGQPVTLPQGADRVPSLSLGADGTAHGFAGCNTFRGTFEQPAPTRIRFSRMAATLMACPGLETERALFEVLEITDSYAVSGTSLSLHKARMAPLARFEALP